MSRPNLNSIQNIDISKEKKEKKEKRKRKFIKKKEKVKGFFIFMSMLPFKQVESNNDKKEPWDQGCGWIIKFSHCFNFGYQ